METLQIGQIYKEPTRNYGKIQSGCGVYIDLEQESSHTTCIHNLNSKSMKEKQENKPGAI